MADTLPTIPPQTAGEPAGPVLSPLWVVMVADERALRCYGPVLRRLAVGLIDEVAELSLLSLGRSKLLRYVPSPPIRLITETRGYRTPIRRINMTDRQTTIHSPYWYYIDRLFPQRRVRRLTDTLRPFKPNLLHALSEQQIDLVRQISRQLQVRYVVSLLDADPARALLSDPLCAGVFCCYSSICRQLRRRYPRRKRRIQFLPIGTHLGKEVTCFSRPAAAPVLMYCGPLTEGRGLSELLQAVQLISESGPLPQLLLSGNGPYQHQLWRQAKELAIQQQVHFLPPVESMLSISDAYKVVFREVDIFVQPWPVKRWRPELLEAMSIGNAVVAVDSINHDLIVKDKTALTVDFGQVDQLAEALQELIHHPERARALAANAQQHLRRHFLTSRMIDRLVRVYRQAVQEAATVPAPKEAV
ncbi:MAG: glycosyltransferase family 4 protein [Sedimentisphaerales bacterium]|nr:glycosyltransferase family 4 protein [Sedimentisphaerales bacterium]